MRYASVQIECAMRVKTTQITRVDDGVRNMTIELYYNRCRYLGFFFLLAVMFEAGACLAQNVRFVQITDAHLFDSGKRCSDANINREYRENLAALEWAIKKTNEINAASSNGRPKVDFVAFTGDFGLENVVEPGEQPPPRTNKWEPCFPNEKKGEFFGPVNPVFIEAAASQVASIFSQLNSDIKIFLIPGNNDLKDENSQDFLRYADFVTALQRYLPNRVRDLTNLAGSQIKGPLPVVNGLHLLGLNTASFKPTEKDRALVLKPVPNSATTVSCGAGGKGAQLLPLGEEPTGSLSTDSMMVRGASLQQYYNDVAETKGQEYILFTHVPDVADPITDCRAPVRYRSSWFLDENLRKRWETELASPQMVATFAGHFHSDNRALYAVPSSALPPTISSPSKTYIAPPISMKFQGTNPPGARGIMLVDIVRKSSGWLVQDGTSAPVGSFIVGPPTAIWYCDPPASALPFASPTPPVDPSKSVIMQFKNPWLLFLYLAFLASLVMLIGTFGHRSLAHRRIHDLRGLVDRWLFGGYTRLYLAGLYLSLSGLVAYALFAKSKVVYFLGLSISINFFLAALTISAPLWFLWEHQAWKSANAAGHPVLRYEQFKQDQELAARVWVAIIAILISLRSL